ncbi:hypothetical protein NQ317_008178 [Molorchus minor]|uniref:Tyr recombinase domain-containing protein n=1 Tax=Molorchus minor TaxID=1323400 RepID=A0ABQ9JJB1_9CUCU|nr:hypothetical protein NQ317_008178 [Molorchus minor]
MDINEAARIACESSLPSILRTKYEYTYTILKNGVSKECGISVRKRNAGLYVGKIKPAKIVSQFMIDNNSRLFLRYQYGKYVNQPVGKQTFAKMPLVITQFLNLADANLYTRHCFRSSSANLLIDSEGISNLKRHGGWKSSTVAETYVAESIKNKLDVANKILYQENPVPLKKRLNANAMPSTSDIAGEFLTLQVASIPTTSQIGFPLTPPEVM